LDRRKEGGKGRMGEGERILKLINQNKGGIKNWKCRLKVREASTHGGGGSLNFNGIYRLCGTTKNGKILWGTNLKGTASSSLERKPGVVRIRYGPESGRSSSRG